MATPAADVPDYLDLDCYHSQIWDAVDCSDIFTVRKLINRWCRVDIKKGNMTLKELALIRGTDRIITLVLKMEPTLKFIHYVIQNKYEESRTVLELHRDDINVNFSNMKYMSVTPLYFALRNRNLDITKMILNAGGRLDHCLVLNDESELPLLFQVLQWNLPDDLFQLVVEHAAVTLSTTSGGTCSLLEHLRYHGHTVLHWCVRFAIQDERIAYLIDVSTARLISFRNDKNQTVLDISPPHLRELILSRIKSRFNDQTEEQLLLDFVCNGFDYTWEIVSEDASTSPLVSTVRQLERAIYRFICAVEYSDYDNVVKCSFFPYKDREICLLNCRNLADGQPPFHKAVLKQNPVIVRHFCEVLLRTCQIRLDSIRDNFNRTALCYAYANTNPSQEVIDLLLDHGSSEYTMDKDDRSPQLFREARGHPLIEEFVQFHSTGDYRSSEMIEPAIWAPRPHESSSLAPLFYRRCCLHRNHSNGISTSGHRQRRDSDDLTALRDTDSSTSSLSDSEQRLGSNSYACHLL